MTVGFWSFVFLCVHQTLIGLYCTKEGLCLKPDGELDVGRHLFKKKKFSLSRHTFKKNVPNLPNADSNCRLHGFWIEMFSCACYWSVKGTLRFLPLSLLLSAGWGHSHKFK